MKPYFNCLIFIIICSCTFSCKNNKESVDDSYCNVPGNTCLNLDKINYGSCVVTQKSEGNDGIYLYSVKAESDMYIDVWKRDAPGDKWVEVLKGYILKKGTNPQCEKIVDTNERLKVEVRESSRPDDYSKLKMCRVNGGYQISVEFESAPSTVTNCEKVNPKPGDDYGEALFYLRGNFPNN